MRGENGQSANSFPALRRYTPTCVGKTPIYSQLLERTQVHPHMRGENLFNRTYEGVNTGTPPHAWGKLNRVGSKNRLVRYTPTCVGKTPHEPGSQARVRYTPTCVGKTALTTGKLPTPTVHPHMRGENGPRLQNCNLAIGTPPHAWGKLSPRGGAYWRARYTPTCVGKTDV